MFYKLIHGVQFIAEIGQENAVLTEPFQSCIVFVQM